MNSSLRRDLKEIIDRSCSSDIERQMLAKVFFALAEHQEKFLSELESRIITESVANDCDKDFDIAVELVKYDDLKARGEFFPVETSTDLIFDDKTSSPFDESATVDAEIFQSTFFLAHAFQGCTRSNTSE